MKLWQRQDALRNLRDVVEDLCEIALLLNQSGDVAFATEAAEISCLVSRLRTKLETRTLKS